jgi:hypothetical protein
MTGGAVLTDSRSRRGHHRKGIQDAAGIARFSGCAIDKAGTYTLTATDGKLTPTTSSTITITAAV